MRQLLIVAALCGISLANSNVWDQPCRSRGGNCQENILSCSGVYYSGMCDGSASRQCCLPNGMSSDSSCHDIGGVCGTTGCTETWHSGRCGGASDRRCCSPARKNTGSACFGRMCSTHTNNLARQCDSYGCGYYNAPRGSRLHGGTDMRCTGGATVYAPFSGTVVRDSPPYGDGSCCDNGFVIRGTGAFNGWEVMMFYIQRSLSLGASFSKGQAIAQHIGLHCGCYATSMTDHVHVQMYRGISSHSDPSPYTYCTSPGMDEDPPVV